MKKNLFSLIFAICIIGSAYSQQITVDTTLSPVSLVQDSLVSGCVDAFNVYYTGNLNAIGYFNAAGTSFDTIMSSGIVMASGDATNVIGPNNSSGVTTNYNGPGDSDLDGLITQSTWDAAVLEFDFIPSSDTLQFKYVFGSDEYLEYVGSFNDVFAFFLSGPNPSGGSYANENIAIIPGTTLPVSINNVNTTSYPIYYVVNGTGSSPNNEALQYDGYTTALYATALVTPCETYHIKLAVADAADHVLDSGVFIESGSFTDGSAVTINNVNPTGTQNDLYEGCTSYYVFMRQDTNDVSQPVNIPLAFTGTATNGVDLTQFPTTVTIPAGQVSDTIPYTVFNDGLTEPTETFIISILAGCPCNPQPASDTITLYDFAEFKASIVNTDSMFCGMAAPPTYDIVATCISHPAWFINYTWNTGATDTAITVVPPLPGQNDVYWVQIDDICGNSITDSITIGVSNLAGLNVSSTDALCYGACNGTANAVPVTIGSTPGKYFKWSDMASSTPLGVRNDLCYGNYTVTVTDDSYCAFEQDFTISQPPTSLNASSGILPIDTFYCTEPGEITLNAFANISNVNFAWNGGAISNNTKNVVPNVGINTFWVDISDYCGFTISDTVHIYVSGVENATLSLQNQSCFGVCDAAVEVNDPLAILPVNYLFTSNNSGSFITSYGGLDSLCADTFSLVATDYTGCQYIEDFILESPEAFSFTESKIITTDTMWCGVNPPSFVQIEAYCNLPDASFLWNNGATTNFININPVQGTTIYSVTISDDCGNSISDSVHIIISDFSSINLSTQPTSCYNSCDGEVNIIPSGGITPYSYDWTPAGIGSTSSGSINTLCSGSYSVLVRDDAGCEFIDNFDITSPPDIHQNYISNTDTLFCGVSAPATITIQTVTNQTLSYMWNTGESSTSITFAPQTGANIYWVDFIDGCGNTYRDSIVFSVSNFSGANLIKYDASCYGDCDGEVVITPLFGLTPYSFEWTVPGVGTTQAGVLDNICAGTYQVTVSDLADCYVVKDFLINQPDSITYDFLVQPSNGSNCDGYASVISLNGGTSPYSFLWDDPNAQTTYNAQNLCPGIYNVTVSDSKQCESVDTVRVPDLNAIPANDLLKFVEVYPNPGNGKLFVRLGELQVLVDQIKIYTINGREIALSGKMNSKNDVVEISGLPEGVNLLSISLKDHRILRKRIVVIR